MKHYEQMRPKGDYESVLRQREKDGIKFYTRFNREFVDVDCPACGKQGIKSFRKYGFQHKTCDDCSTIFCSPRPKDDLLSIYYNEYEAPMMWTQLLIKADVERKALQYGPRIKKIIAGMRKQGMASGGVALDVGAGSGAFTVALKNSGFFSDVIALDLSDNCVDVLKENGMNAKKGSVSDMDDGSVDFICMNDLIEHLFDPFTFLRDCFRVLRPNGYLSVATPNGEGFDFKILKDKTKNITPPEHLNYFNPNSMGIIMSRAGFETVLVETPGMLDVDIILREKNAGFPLQEKNEYLDYLLGQEEKVMKRFQRFLATNRLSSHMLALARRP